MSPAALRQAVLEARRHPAARTFVGLYIAGILILSLYSNGNFLTVIGQLVLTALELVYLALTIMLTPNPPPDQPSRGRSLLGQYAFLAGLLAFTFLYTSLFHAARTGAEPLNIPGFTALAQALVTLDTRLANPLLYVLVPLVVLTLIFGVRPSGLGLRPGYRSLAVGLVWIAVNALFAIIQVLTGRFTLAFVVNRVVGNVLQNGFVEEFLWRGVIQTRLALWLTPAWGALISTLLFGLWHFDANLGMFQNQALPTLAFCIVSQARFGLVMSVVFLRTRSLVAPGLAHTFANLTPLNFL